MRRTQPTIAGFEGEGATSRDTEQPLDAEEDVWLTTTGTCGPHTRTLRRLNSADNLHEQGSRFSPGASREEAALLTPNLAQLTVSNF